MPFYLSPIGNEQQFNTSGDPLTGGKIYTYLSGSTTPTATYTDSTGVTPQANPIILSSLGVPTSPIWLLGGVTTKFVIKDALENTLRTIDNVSGINDVSAPTVNEWVNSGLIPTYISGTSFSFPGDQRAVFQVDRRVLTTNTAGSRYGTITVSSFSAGLTTITLLMDSGTLDSGLSAVFYGIISVTNTSLPLTSSGLVAAINSVLTTPGPIGGTTPNTGAFTTLSASTSAAVPTVAQFDNDTSVATTALVQQALGNLAGTATYNTSTNIAASDVGKWIFIPSGTGSISLALPTTAVTAGSQYRVYNNTAASNVTLTTTGTITSGGSGGVGSIVVGPGQTFDVTTDGVNNWVISQGDFTNQARLSTGLNASGTAPMYVARALMNFNGTGTPAVIGTPRNMLTSITDNGAGDYTLFFDVDMPNADYVMAGTATGGVAGQGVIVNYRATGSSSAPTSKTTSECRIRTSDVDSAEDAAYISVVFFC